MTKLTKDQKELLCYIKKLQPIFNREVAGYYQVSTRRIRYRVKELRRLGFGILPTNKGYVISRKVSDLLSKSEQMRHQGLSLLRTARDLKKRAESKANARLRRIA